MTGWDVFVRTRIVERLKLQTAVILAGRRESRRGVSRGRRRSRWHFKPHYGVTALTVHLCRTQTRRSCEWQTELATRAQFQLRPAGYGFETLAVLLVQGA